MPAAHYIIPEDQCAFPESSSPFSTRFLQSSYSTSNEHGRFKDEKGRPFDIGIPLSMNSGPPPAPGQATPGSPTTSSWSYGIENSQSGSGIDTPSSTASSSGSLELESTARAAVTAKFPCHICGKPFTRKQNMSRHIGDKHRMAGERYRCHKCGEDQGRSDRLRAHEKNCRPQYGNWWASN